MCHITNYYLNAKENNEVSPHTARKAIIKKPTNNKCWRGCAQEGTLSNCWWKCKLIQPLWRTLSVQFSSVDQSCLTLCDSIDCSIPGFSVYHQLLELTQTHVHQVGDAIHSSHPLSYPSPPAFNLSQHQGLFKWVGFSHQVAKVLEFQLQHQSFQWIFRTDFL